jgi:F-type H+-transporting ATPase subunit delta
MSQGSIPLVYARALFEAAESQGKVEDVYEDVLVIQELVGNDPLARAFFDSPRIARSEKAALIARNFQGKLSDILVNFLQVLIRRGRHHFLRPALEAYRELRNKSAGIVHATAVSAVPLSDESRTALLGRLERGLQKKIELKSIVREEIVGGIIVRFDGMVADGSISSALRRIRNQMLQPKFGSEYVHEDQR